MSAAEKPPLLPPRPSRRPFLRGGLPGALLVAAVLLITGLPLADAKLVVAEKLSDSTAGAATPYKLANTAPTVTHACGTATVTVWIHPAAARANINITLPAACRGTAFLFRAPASFVAAAHMESELGLYSSTWTANMGTINMCVRATVAGCVSSNPAMNSATAPPLSTTIGALVAGRSYGPTVTTHLAAPGGTATIVLTEEIILLNTATGAVAWVQNDEFLFTIVQL